MRNIVSGQMHSSKAIRHTVCVHLIRDSCGHIKVNIKLNTANRTQISKQARTLNAIHLKRTRKQVKTRKS